jgi:hypothetical protein
MKLPSDYLALVRVGATVLHSVGARLRDAAAADPGDPELWLSVRDFEGLAARLVEPTDWEWRHGVADHHITPQDFGVLDEVLARRHSGPVQVADDDLISLVRLDAFLRQYSGGVFELDEPWA